MLTAARPEEGCEAHVCDISSCKQDLSDGLLELTEQVVPQCNQTTLTDRSKGLQTTTSDQRQLKTSLGRALVPFKLTD